jgi:hypothetical protein
MATYLDSLGDNQFVVVRDINHPRQELLIDANSLNNDSVTYKVYTALLSQAGIDAPTAIVLENTIGDIVWSYSSTGEYNGTLVNAFTEDKTYLFAYILPNSVIKIERNNEDQINVGTTTNSLAKTNGLLNSTSIEIRVYN